MKLSSKSSWNSSKKKSIPLILWWFSFWESLYYFSFDTSFWDFGCKNKSHLEMTINGKNKFLVLNFDACFFFWLKDVNFQITITFFNLKRWWKIVLRSKWMIFMIQNIWKSSKMTMNYLKKDERRFLMIHLIEIPDDKICQIKNIRLILEHRFLLKPIDA